MMSNLGEVSNTGTAMIVWYRGGCKARKKDAERDKLEIIVQVFRDQLYITKEKREREIMR